MASGTTPKPFSEVGKVYTKTLVHDTAQSFSLFIPSNFRSMLIIESSNIDRCASLLVISFTSGMVYIQAISKGNDISFTTTTNNLSWSSSNSGVSQVMVLGIGDNTNSVDFL